MRKRTKIHPVTNIGFILLFIAGLYMWYTKGLWNLPFGTIVIYGVMYITVYKTRYP